MDNALDDALDQLGMLSTVTNARKEYINEMRLRGRRSLACISPRRQQHFTRETRSLEKTMIYSAVHANKMINRRVRGRQSPYDLHRRRPFHALRTLNGYEDFRLDSYNNNPWVKSSWKPFTNTNCDAKTDEQFPVPVLYRSKSLEDLRKASSSLADGIFKFKTPFELPIENLKEDLSTCMREFDSRLSLSLSPRSNSFSHSKKKDQSENITLSNVSTDVSNANNSNNYCPIKKEIESMSMRIEKLDVA